MDDTHLYHRGDSDGRGDEDVIIVNIVMVETVSYTHLTLPTNREV